MKNIKSSISLFLFVFIIYVLTGCKKDEDPGFSLPPAESMEMDFSFVRKKATPLADSSHYAIARAAVTYWKVAAYAHTSIPVLAFKTAISNKPVYDSEKDVYTWSYTFKIGGDTYSASLTGKTGTQVDSVEWVMNISKVGIGAPFKWFEGKSAMDRSGGWWTLYYPIIGKTIEISWEKKSGGEGYLRYTNIVSDNLNNGAYIEFGSDPAKDLDKYFKIYIKNDTIHPANNERTYTIEWNSISQKGQIKWDENRFCWGTDYVNTVCE